MSVNEDNLDMMHSKIILMRGDRCVTCGETDRQKFQCGHIFSRYWRPTRWDISPNGNCHIQCYGCNMKHEDDPSIYYQWYMDKFGEEMFYVLDAMHQAKIHDYDSFLEQTYATLFKFYNEILNGYEYA